ncbi:MAG: leucine--tRNA ligase [Actinomycetota bacterium]|nr:leucine--tRNA ligase [Actinomycetota bacterium]
MGKEKVKKFYNPREIEKRLIKKWEKEKIFSLKSSKDDPKYYLLEMFPYPSGEPHMGHARNYTIGDVAARVLSRKGHNVLHPIGFDAFGLPAENAAIKNGMHPRESTMSNIEKMRVALKRMGISYDFSDEVITSEPDYYKWTQWLFLLLYKMGLAEKKEAAVNWCNSCQTVLANEQVISGKCERCGSQVEKKNLSQWFFKITDYAQRLLDDMELLEGGWPERALNIQRNWIGRSGGATVNFKLDGKNALEIPVFTTRPDTLFGVTFFILAPEHPLVDKIVEGGKYRKDIEKARDIISRQSDIERGSAEVKKIGCFTGRHVINPLNGEEVPVWIANYVLLEYGTGAIMAVPAHDERDFEFAAKYGIPIREVISPDGKNHDVLDTAYTGEGIMVNSGRFSGLPSEKGKKEINSYLEKNKIGKSSVNYKLRDWLISRQRYWGAPIPIIYCDRCGAVPVPEKDLPVVLPYDVDFRPRGLSPLTYSEEFVNTTCPVCGGKAKRETDTMDTFVCSSWYFLRYCSPHNDKRAFNSREVDYWMPVDQYIGGIEHASMHLIYSRFFTKVLYDSGLVKFREPFIKYFPHGIVNLSGQKMSKSKGNIVNPSEIYNKFGADTLRLYILFMGPADSPVDWSNSGVEGASRFLKRLWRLAAGNIELLKKSGDNKTGSSDIKEDDSSGDALYSRVKDEYNDGKLSSQGRELYKKLHQTIRKVTDDILERFNFNTAISAVMELVNLFYKYREDVDDGSKNLLLVREVTRKLLIILSPITPFITEELWLMSGYGGSIHKVKWPDYDSEIAKEEMTTIVFQVNGKLRDKAELAVDTPEDRLKEFALSLEKIKKYTDGREIVKEIVVPGKLVNIVVK